MNEQAELPFDEAAALARTLDHLAHEGSAQSLRWVVAKEREDIRRVFGGVMRDSTGGGFVGRFFERLFVWSVSRESRSLRRRIRRHLQWADEQGFIEEAGLPGQPLYRVSRAGRAWMVEQMERAGREAMRGTDVVRDTLHLCWVLREPQRGLREDLLAEFPLPGEPETEGQRVFRAACLKERPLRLERALEHGVRARWLQVSGLEVELLEEGLAQAHALFAGEWEPGKD